MLEVARRTDREAELNPDDELRVWYVAVTRAKERLTLVEPQSTQSLRCKWL
jgi:ATP-dependent exoDNAse (exonuclease V) beta subunit